MASRPPNGPDRDVPSSPDELGGGLRGPIGGVTRIGPRAFGIAFMVIVALLVAILYGLNRGSSFKKQTLADSTPAPAAATIAPQIAPSLLPYPQSPVTTPPPPIVLPTTLPPDIASDNGGTKAAAVAPPVTQPAGPSAADEQAERDREAREKAEAEAAKAREDRLLAARKSAILTGQGVNQAGDASQNAGGFVGNGESAVAVATSAPATATTNGSSGGTASFAGGNSVSAFPNGSSSALVGRNAAYNTNGGGGGQGTFLNGPTSQFSIQPANVQLPAGGNKDDFLQAQRFYPLSPFELTASSVIPASLITGIDSELPGILSAEVREDVYDTKTGRYLLIPKGSRLVGVYKSGAAYGQTRVEVAWRRLIFPDTTSIDLLNMTGADSQGAAGLGGTVDNHYGKIFGAALLTSILAAGLELSQPQTAGSSVFNTQSPGQVVSQSVGTNVLNLGTQIVQKDLSIPPTLYIPKGYPFLVVVDRDIVLPGPYRPQ